MGEQASGTVQHAGDTFVAQLMRSKVAVELLSAAPIPLFLVRSILARDNARENRKDSWQRLRGTHLSAMPEMDSSSTSAARRGSFRKV